MFAIGKSDPMDPNGTSSILKNICQGKVDPCMDGAAGGSLHHGLRELFGFFYQFLCFFRDYFSRSIRFLGAISWGQGRVLVESCWIVGDWGWEWRCIFNRKFLWLISKTVGFCWRSVGVNALQEHDAGQMISELQVRIQVSALCPAENVTPSYDGLTTGSFHLSVMANLLTLLTGTPHLNPGFGIIGNVASTTIIVFTCRQIVHII